MARKKAKTWKGLKVSHSDRHHTYLHTPFEIQEDIEEMFDLPPETFYALFDGPDAVAGEVPLDNLVAWQEHVTKEGVQRYLDDPEAEPEVLLGLPRVARYMGRYYLMDGTHRFTAAYIRGDQELLAQVADIDAIKRKPTRKLKRRLMR